MAPSSSERSEFSSEISGSSHPDPVGEARARLHAAFPPRSGPGAVKAAIGQAARRLGWPESRTRDVWYGDARRIDVPEMDRLRSLTRSSQLSTSGTPDVDEEATRMTPAERETVLELLARMRQGLTLNLNERMLIQKLETRISLDLKGALTEPEARYLRRIAEKQGIEISDDGGQGTEDGEGPRLAEGPEPANPDPPSVVSHPSLAPDRRAAELVKYTAAKRALAEARSVDEVKGVRDRAAAVQAYAEMAGDTQLEEDAAEIRLRAERKLGEAISEAKEAGQLSEGGRPSRKKKTSSNSEEVSERKTLADLGVDHKLSSYSQKIAALPEEQFEATVTRMRSDIASGKRSAAKAVVREAAQGGPVNGARSVMGSRKEPSDSLDYFPTPPWATRALMEHVLPQLGVRGLKTSIGSVWEPACGEGHMSGVLEEYFGTVLASDVFDYSVGGKSPPGWIGARDFLNGSPLEDAPEWIITNPPFEEKGLAFALRALDQAKVGVAMFVRLQWLETIERYEQLYRDRPPTLISFFVERVNLCKGRWDPKGGTATAYIWLTWVKGVSPRAPFWIPPVCRETLTRPDDIERFTAHPCVGTVPEDENETVQSIKAWRDPSDGSIRSPSSFVRDPTSDLEDIPPELRRPLPEVAE